MLLQNEANGLKEAWLLRTAKTDLSIVSANIQDNIQRSPVVTIIFFYRNKRNIHVRDISVIYILLGGAVLLDSIAMVKLVFSEWTVVIMKDAQEEYERLKRRRDEEYHRIDPRGMVKYVKKRIEGWVLCVKRNERIIKIVNFLKNRISPKQRWSETMKQYSLLNHSLNSRWEWVDKILDYLGLIERIDSFQYTKLEPVEKSLRIRKGKYTSQLSNVFKMKDLGATKKIVGMEIHMDRQAGKLYLSLKKVWVEHFNFAPQSYSRQSVYERPPPLSALRTPSTFTATSFSFVISGAMFDHPSVQMCCQNVELAGMVREIENRPAASHAAQPRKKYWFRSARRSLLHHEKQQIGGGGSASDDLCSGTGRDATSSRSPARFLSSPPPFVKTAEWRSPTARFRSGSIVIGSAPARSNGFLVALELLNRVRITQRNIHKNLSALAKFVLGTLEVVAINVKLFSYNSIRSATQHFHPSNKIGGGGFGVVYKRLADIKEAAGIPAECKDDIVEIKAELSCGKGVWKELFVNPSSKIVHILLAGVGVHFFQQTSAVDAVVMYSPKIFEKAGIETETQQLLASIAVGFSKMIFCLVATFLLVRVGRRVLDSGNYIFAPCIKPN
nr:polyol transporter 5-like [Ipomoea batatas]